MYLLYYISTDSIYMKINDQNLIDRIISTTKSFLLKKRIKGWNLDDLARETGIAKMTLYKIIESKEKLIEKVIMNYICELQENIILMINKYSDERKILIDLIESYPDLFNNEFNSILAEIYKEYPTIEKNIRFHQNKATDMLIELFSKAQKNKIIRDDVSPEFILILLKSVLNHFIEYDEKNFSKNAKLAFNCIFNGIFRKE